MLVSMKEILDRASKENYGVIAPNVFCELDTRAAIAAAEKMNSPIIIDVSVGQTKGITLAGEYITKLAEDSYLPIAVNLDHGGSAVKPFDVVTKEIMQALKGGFTSVMVDRCAFPYEQNVEETAILTKMAHALGVSVEAELGKVGSGTAYDKAEDMYTDPKVAKDFVERTGVDCLAVAVGTAHGLYKGIPHLAFDRIKEIKEAVGGLPLVVHGGSGTGHDNLRKACSMGINKVNIGHDIVQNVCNMLKTEDLSGLKAYNVYSNIQRAAMEKICELMEVFGSVGKAWKVERTYAPAEDKLLGFVGDSV